MPHVNRDVPELPAPLQAAIDAFKDWNTQQLLAEQKETAIEAPLYHYTDLKGLRGILHSGCFWFTDYRHLNDPSEIQHGIGMAREIARGLADTADGRVRLFLENFIDLFRLDNFDMALRFFIACLSRARDDLGQWRAYADNGHGVAIGLSPRLFTVIDQPLPGHLPEFVGPVRYLDGDARPRHHLPLERAAAIFLKAADANRELLSDKVVGIPFIDQLAREIIASPMIWNCLTTKHPGYAHEQEVRLVIMGTPARLSSHIATRRRGPQDVSYIAHALPLREPDHIVEIVIGPAASASEEQAVRAVLHEVGLDGVALNRSSIPYRG